MKSWPQLISLGVLFLAGVLLAVWLFTGAIQVHTRDGRLNLQLHTEQGWHYFIAANLSDIDAGKRRDPEPEDL